MPWIDRAINDTDKVAAREMFEAPNPHNPGGLSDAEMVRKGDYQTMDMSRWV
jgi:hypothetical protein